MSINYNEKRERKKTTHLNSKEQDGFIRERFRKVVNSRQTTRKNCRKNSRGDARESCWPCANSSQNLIQREFSTSYGSLLLAFFRTHKGKLFYERGRGKGGRVSRVCARARKWSSLRNSSGIVTFLGGSLGQRHGRQ